MLINSDEPVHTGFSIVPDRTLLLALVQRFKVQKFKDRLGRELPRFENYQNIEMSGTLMAAS
jgi:hypothetical protein